MICPKCEAVVVWRDLGDSTYALYDLGETATVGSIGDKGQVQYTTGQLVAVHRCPDQQPDPEGDPYDLPDDDPFANLDAFWLWVKNDAFLYSCPEERCQAEPGDPCRHLTQRTLNRWPHKARVRLALTNEQWNRAASLGYLS